MLGFRKFIEASYESEDVPERYYVVGNFSEHNPEVPEQLSKLELPGVSGVSGSESIIRNFLGVAREMLLVMDGYQFEKLNNLSKIQYDNPEYLVSNNLDGLLRIWAYGSGDLDKYRSSVMTKLFDYIELAAKQLAGNARYEARSDFENKASQLFYAIQYDGGRKFSDLPKVRNTWDIAKWLQRNAKKDDYYYGIDFTPEEAHQIIIKALQLIGDVFKDEDEWRVKNRTTRIPEGSELYILTPEISQDKWSNYVQDKLSKWSKYNLKYKVESMSFILNAINQYKLNRLYELKFIHAPDFNEHRSGLDYETVKSIAKDSPFTS